MKIKRLEINNFRAFPNHAEPFAIELNGKSLLLYGENGSGKSSLYLAMREFFNLDPMAEKYETYCNLFTEDEIGPRGSICAELADGRRLLWDRNDSGIRAHHSATIPRDDASLIVDAARRAGLLSYLSILQTRVGEGTQAERLFHVTVNSILYGVQVPSGGTERSIHELWSNLRHKSMFLSATPTPQDIQSIDEEVREFNSLFAAKLDLLKETTESLLEYFVGHGLEIQFVFPPLKYVHHKIKRKRRFIPAELHVTIKFRGRTIDAWEGFLNEARLSALAISLFLAGVLASNPAPSPGHDPLQLLVLDDVLFGLDMANRIPVLKILKERFANYQVLLLTHDRVWYDIARGQLPENDGWSHQRLIADEAQGLLVPRIRPGLSDLALARKHLNNDDLKAAAVYARAAFEVRIQNACEKNGIQIAYRRDVNEVTLDKLWTAIVERQTKREEYQKTHPGSLDFISRSLIAEVESMRSNVLNALSHANSPGLNKAEVKDAIDTVEKLQRHTFPEPR